ncbi:MAG: AMP-dependent synthetase/ligase [Rhodothermales bacterium]
MPGPIFTAPPNTGTAVLGKSLTDLLYEAVDQYPNEKAFNQPLPDGTWKPYSLDQFRIFSEWIALGLLDYGLERGDRVALFMESDVYFCMADMACLLSGLVDVPIYLTHGPEHIQHIIEQSGSRVLFVSNAELLGRVAPLLRELPNIKAVITTGDEAACKRIPLPEGVKFTSMQAMETRGRERASDDPGSIALMLRRVKPHDLATLIYTSGTTGLPKGVMLTHENISFNAMTSFSGLGNYQPGVDGEVALSFLPLTHIFARALHYGFVAHGTSVYFTSPENLLPSLKAVQPTVFATVPRLLEKVYDRIIEAATTSTGVKKRLLGWALGLAGKYEAGRQPSRSWRMQGKVADKLVFAKWRAALGSRVKYIICGGAALNADLMNLYAAADINILQGYGLTETSPVITFNRPTRNKAGTVGEPLPGVEVRLGDDGEIQTRGPHVMRGYYDAPEKTAEVMLDGGWFCTGDIGEFTPDGFLRITDRKKDLFKLSTGKYVMPQPLEMELVASPIIEQAVVVGPGYKFTMALLFPNEEALRVQAASWGVDASLPLDQLLKHPTVLAKVRFVVDQANQGMEHWSTIKAFKLMTGSLSVENGMLTPTLKVKRKKVREAYQDAIDALYEEAKQQGTHALASAA